ncbi:Siderophore triacetylfusarinine C esterase [Exophiala dermatitidis]
MQLPHYTVHEAESCADAVNTTQWDMRNYDGEEIRVQLAWPLAWRTPSEQGASAPVIYVLDGNTLFFSAVETVRRSTALQTSEDAIVVGIGYPPTASASPYDPRRNYDLTPPSPTYTPPRGPDGKPHPAPHGGATKFLQFVTQSVREFLFSDICEGVTPSKEVLVGHSFGGLCTLHALFSSLTPFTTFIALSPSIWWNDRYILSEEEHFRNSSVVGQKPTLLIAYGSYEQEPRRRPSWSEEWYQRIRDKCHERRMKDNADEMAGRLRASGKLEALHVREYHGEDHGSLAACGLSWGISAVLDEDRFE